MSIKRTARAVVVSIFVIGIAGCGGGSDSGEAAPSSAPEVRVVASGDVESTLATNGSIFCGPGEGSDPEFMFELYAMSPPEGLNMRLNRDLEPGMHPIVGSDDDARDRGADAYFYYTGPDRTRFDQVNSGSITIENMPTAVGEKLVASIQADVSDEDGSSISIKVDLSVSAGRQTFDECP